MFQNVHCTVPGTVHCHQVPFVSCVLSPARCIKRGWLKARISAWITAFQHPSTSRSTWTHGCVPASIHMDTTQHPIRSGFLLPVCINAAGPVAFIMAFAGQLDCIFRRLDSVCGRYQTNVQAADPADGSSFCVLLYCFFCRFLPPSPVQIDKMCMYRAGCMISGAIVEFGSGLRTCAFFRIDRYQHVSYGQRGLMKCRHQSCEGFLPERLLP